MFGLSHVKFGITHRTVDLPTLTVDFTHKKIGLTYRTVGLPTPKVWFNTLNGLFSHREKPHSHSKDMTRRFLYIIAATTLIMSTLFSCSDSNSDNQNEYENWKSRNEAYFSSVRKAALDSIATAKAAFGDNWGEHTAWRTYLSYSLNPAASTNTATDSIFVEILKDGSGSGAPISTDSVRVFYLGRLIPTDIHPEGYIFDHSGQSNLPDRIFNHVTGVPTTFMVGNTVRGLATALQYMHIGDMWRVYVPYTLAYDSEQRTGIPAYSTLVFDIELVQYSHKGSALPPW